MPGSTNPWASELKARKTSGTRRPKTGNPDDNPDPEILLNKDKTRETETNRAALAEPPQIETRGGEIAKNVRENERKDDLTLKVAHKPETVKEVKKDKSEVKISKIEPEINNPKVKPEIKNPKAESEVQIPKVELEIKNSKVKSEAKNPKVEPELQNPKVESEIKKPEVRSEAKNPKIEPEIKNPKVEMNKRPNEPLKAMPVPPPPKTKVKTLPVEVEDGKGSLYQDARSHLKRVVTRQISRTKDENKLEADEEDLTPIDRLIRQGSFEPTTTPTTTNNSNINSNNNIVEKDSVKGRFFELPYSQTFVQ